MIPHDLTRKKGSRNLDVGVGERYYRGAFFANIADNLSRRMSPDTLLQALVSGTLLGCFYTLTALAFSMILGIARSLNLAHGELIILGGYLGYWLWAISGLHPIVLLPAAAVALLPLGLLWQWLLHRVPEPKELNSLVLTFGLSLLLQNVMTVVWKSDYRLIASPALTEPLRIGGMAVNQGRILAATVALAAVGLVSLGLTRTRWGRAVRATALDREAAALLGINVDRATRTTFLLAVASAGIAGVLFATLRYVYPAAGVELTLLAIVLAIWAGVGRLSGVLAAGILLGVVEAVTVAWTGPRWRELVVAVILLGSLLVRGRGLARGWGH